MLVADDLRIPTATHRTNVSGTRRRGLSAVSLVTQREAVAVWALADTGADHTLLPASLADEIGVYSSDNEATTMHGFGGKELTVLPGHIDILMDSGMQLFQWSAHVGVVQFDDPADEVVVLGHIGFFEFFAATFDSSARELSLIPTSSFSGTVFRSSV